MSNCEPSRQPIGTGMLYDTTLKLYDSSNPTDGPFDLLKDFENLENSGFKKEISTKIIIPDWQEDHNETWIMEMISADINGYLKFLNNYTLNHVINKKVHIIGNGIGAHIAGLVGAHFQNHTIDRITGLDPASSGFENALRKHRLDRTDAEFVDVIHTCIDMIGIKQAIGDVDFYPNGGMCNRQPGCESAGQNSSQSLYTCGHSKAAQYMTQSISEPKKFMATQDLCGKKNKTAAYMGEKADRNILGRYSLNIKE
ncbi:inactive pancreatic lipase-related protein 1-like [Aphidius gifuensis]|uniref:inactive pancreatic lipase-related protein 1-like n=1 Tax=Aphidius gifuensis TaxID=684658 RepID=UPI001CDC144A|nr:inactive pancreatic lipase-related protein 1-like [Aphidius gifuensis]